MKLDARWRLQPLSDVVDILDSQRVPVKASDRAKLGGSIPYYGATGQAGTINRAIFNEPLVLLGEDGAPFFDLAKPKAYLIDGPAWVNNHAHVLRTGQDLDRSFLKHYLDAFDYRGFANGTTRLKLTQGAMRRIPVPTPKLSEQRRIVEILEEHLSHLDAAHSSLTLAHARQVAWMKSTLQELVWDESLPLTTVAEVLREPMRNGRSDRSSEEPSAVRTLTLTAVTQGEFSERNTKRTTTTRDVAAGLWLEPGDVFVQRSNTPELVGTSARYDGPREWAIFPDLLIRLRPDEGLMDSRFLVAALQSERAHRTMRARAKGLAGSMPKIDQQAVGDTVLPLPSMERQREIIGQLAKRGSESNRLKSSLDTATRRGQALRRAVLAAAFAGKLTGRRMDVEVIEELAQQ